MDKDPDEFFNIVGTKSTKCREFITFRLSVNGAIEEQLYHLRCGFFITEVSPRSGETRPSAEASDTHGTKCRICNRYITTCDCDVGVRCELTEDETIKLCSPELCPKN